MRASLALLLKRFTIVTQTALAITGASRLKFENSVPQYSQSNFREEYVIM